MAHYCSTLLLHCIDFRFGPAIHRWMEEHGLVGDCDKVSLAGAVKNIVAPRDSRDREFVLEQIDIALRMHHITRIILMNHTDCGAYGGRGAFASEEEERKRHEGDLVKAAAIIRDRFPKLTQERWLAIIAQNGGVHFERL